MKVSVCTYITLAGLAASALAQNNTIPEIPALFPDGSQAYVINASFLALPIVTTAVDYIKKTVNPTLLALQPSTYVLFGNVTYPAAQETSACHWGNGPTCVRTADTADYKADLTTCPAPQQWGITYDDGPNGETPGTADVRASLKSANIKATFFVLGSSIKNFPGLLKQAYDEGHQIASHGWTHRPFTSLTNEQIVGEIKFTEAIIYQQIGQVPTMFRPPYGDIDDRVRAIINALGYRMVLWTTYPDTIIRDTEDTTTAVQANIPGAVANITKWFTDPVNANRGFISLEHDQNPTTVAISLAVLDAFKNATTSQLKPQPVAQCLGLPAYRVAATPTATAATTQAPKTATATAAGTAAAATTSDARSTGISVAITLIAVILAVVSSNF